MSAKRPIISFAIALSIILSGWPSLADIYRYRDENGVWHFTNIKSDRKYKLYIREKPEVFIEKHSLIIQEASEKFGVKTSLIKAVIHAESGFDEYATSKKGAQGLMQLMPKTAQELDVENPYQPVENIFGGTQYLSNLLGRYNNNMKLALAAYNAGPENVDKYDGIPPFPETKNFIKKVLDFYNRYEQAGK